jgi:hypothetical protein
MEKEKEKEKEKDKISLSIPNSHFDFSQLLLSNPVSIQGMGGGYFTKILCNQKPLYIQTPKSTTRQGFVKNGKKILCDLMFNNEDNDFIMWMENLETKCQQLIFEKSNEWFENKLDINDIESAFNSPIKIYKSGKYYLLRTHIKTNITTNSHLVRIYNENELSLTIDDVNNESQIISILEIQGIKFSTRNFQIEIELKQIMVLNDEQIFENCLINKNSSKTINTTSSLDKITNTVIQNMQNETTDKPILIMPSQFLNLQICKAEEAELAEEAEEAEEAELAEEAEVKEFAKKEKINNNEMDDLTEIFNLPENDLEVIELKKPNQVYYEIYREARKRAKEAKQKAIDAYLEAKNIKNTYLLDINDSSDDEDS